MHLIVYTSQYTGNKEDINKVLQDISQIAQRNNVERDVTGLLFYVDGRFLQILEGEQPVLEALLEILAKDTRHHSITRLLDSHIHNRDFKQWNMDTYNLSNDDSFDFEQLVRITEAHKSMLQPETKVLSDFYRQVIAGKIRC